jgi:NAD-dependent dihydropyrimidine dehydrogenase PreA subunit
VYTVTINVDTCQGCGDCIDVCAVEVLELAEQNGKTIAVYTGEQDDCLGCMACEEACEDGALIVLEA